MNERIRQALRREFCAIDGHRWRVHNFVGLGARRFCERCGEQYGLDYVDADGRPHFYGDRPEGGRGMRLADSERTIWWLRDQLNTALRERDDALGRLAETEEALRKIAEMSDEDVRYQAGTIARAALRPEGEWLPCGCRSTWERHALDCPAHRDAALRPEGTEE